MVSLTITYICIVTIDSILKERSQRKLANKNTKNPRTNPINILALDLNRNNYKSQTPIKPNNFIQAQLFANYPK